MTTNGQLDTRALTPVRSQPTLLLTAATEAAFAALRAAVYAAYGWWLTLTDAYRDYATQERIFRQRYTTTYLPGRPRKWWLGRWWYLKSGYAMAAVPGTSNHGWGTTVDITGLGGFGGTKYRQLATVAPHYGWSNAEGAAIGEAWHWNHTGGATVVTNPIGGGATVPGVDVTAPTPIEEDPLAAFTEEQLRRMMRDEIRTVLGLGGSNMSMPDLVASVKAVPDTVWGKHVNANSQGLGEATAAQYLADIAVHARKGAAK